ncbi:MAG: alpha/beta fold hydrolase [Chloroflexia bacterium]
MRRRLWLIPLAVLALLFVVPLLVPVPPPPGTVPPETLADPDSRFVEVDGVTIHYKRAGSGEPAVLLLHGFGASTFSWRKVMGPISEERTTVAYDRPGFGLTERPMPGEWSGPNPYAPETQPELMIGLMDALGIERAILVGHSAGGTVALLTALDYPERVQALVLVDAAVYVGGTPVWLRPLWNTPQLRHLGPLLLRSIRRWGSDLLLRAWHDPSRISPEQWEGYLKPLQAENWDRALWEVVRASRPPALEPRLSQVRVPVLVITGDDDRIVPAAQSIRLSQELPQAQLVVLPECGHVPQEECPEAFLEALEPFLATCAPSSR